MFFNRQGTFKYILLFLLTVLLISGFILRRKMPNVIKGFWEPVSVVSQVTTEGVELKKTDGRTNVLVVGVDKRSANSLVRSVLTDTIIVVSVDSSGDNPVLISVPRDLWLDQTKSKINAVYALSMVNNRATEDSEEIAIDTLTQGVEYVLGIPIHYYVVVGFDAFTDAVDAVGGIEVIVDQSFDDYKYPIEGMENAYPESDRYKHIHFDSGPQLMSGDRALVFARSRHSSNPIEGNDFARSRRQQKVIEALRDKILTKKTLFNVNTLSELYGSYKENVKTDITLPELVAFYTRYKDLDVGNVEKIVLSDEPKSDDKLGSGMLMSPDEEMRDEKYNGQYVLIPYDKTFNNVHALVRSTLFK